MLTKEDGKLLRSFWHIARNKKHYTGKDGYVTILLNPETGKLVPISRAASQRK